jgi:hypothetical protein
VSARAIILAGQRPGPDALCDHAGVTFKADIPVGGIPMVQRVATALREAGVVEPFTLSGYPDAKDGFQIIEGGRGPADSALLAAGEGPFPVLLTTCDHALLTADMVKDFIASILRLDWQRKPSFKLTIPRQNEPIYDLRIMPLVDAICSISRTKTLLKRSVFGVLRKISVKSHSSLRAWLGLGLA